MISSLHLDTRPDWRGGQNQILLTLRGLRHRGHPVELLALAGGPLERRATAEGFKVHAIPPNHARLGAAQNLRSIFRTRRFEIVHAHDPHALTAAWLARAHRCAALVAQRRVANPLSRSRVGLARYRAARRILAISQFVAQSVIASGIASEMVEINYEGVDIPAPVAPEARREARRRWGITENEILLGSVGYLLPEKGQEILIRAMPILRRHFPNCRLLLAGDGPCRRSLEKLANEHGVVAQVIFAGFVEKITEVYSALDLFLFPSLAEPLGTSLLAAMSYGLPVVAVASGGVPEIVEPGRNGILVPASVPEDFAPPILHLLENRGEAARLGAAARETIARKFTSDRMVEGTLEKYQRILQESSR